MGSLELSGIPAATWVAIRCNRGMGRDRGVVRGPRLSKSGVAGDMESEALCDGEVWCRYYSEVQDAGGREPDADGGIYRQ
jgi:hypothetical protein